MANDLKQAQLLLQQCSDSLMVVNDIIEGQGQVSVDGIDLPIAHFYWDRVPGRFVDKTSGQLMTGASFTGTVREWYETLIEVTIDLMITVSRRHTVDSECILTCGPDLATIFEASVLYKPLDYHRMDALGTDYIAGTISNRINLAIVSSSHRDQISLVNRPLDFRRPCRRIGIIQVLGMGNLF